MFLGQICVFQPFSNWHFHLNTLPIVDLIEMSVFPSPLVIRNGWCHRMCLSLWWSVTFVSTWHQQVNRKWQVSISWLVLVVIHLGIWWRTLFLLIDSPLQELLINSLLIPSICFPAPSEKHISRPGGVMKSHGIKEWRLNFEFQPALSSNWSLKSENTPNLFAFLRIYVIPIIPPVDSPTLKVLSHYGWFSLSSLTETTKALLSLLWQPTSCWKDFWF